MVVYSREAVLIKQKGARKPRSSLEGGHPNKPAKESFFGKQKVGDNAARRGVKSESMSPPSDEQPVAVLDDSDDDQFDDESEGGSSKRARSKWGAKGDNARIRENQAAAKKPRAAVAPKDVAALNRVEETESDDDEVVVANESRPSKSGPPQSVADLSPPQLDEDDDGFQAGASSTPALKPTSRDVLSDVAPKQSRTLNANKRTSPRAAGGSQKKKGKTKKDTPLPPGQPTLMQCINQEIKKKPDLKELMRTTAEEEEEEARTKKQMKDLADKDWNRDFGHCFPDLYEGLDEGVAALRAKRARKEEMEGEGSESDAEDMYGEDDGASGSQE